MAAEAPTVANVVSLQISLPQLLDLGMPEVGVVNFNILHNFLHILLQQINLQATKVEYRGENADRIKAMIQSLKLGPALYLQEYNITDSIDIQFTKEDLKVTKEIKQQLNPEKKSDSETVVFVEPIVNSSSPTALAFKELEQSVKQLQQQFQALKNLSTTPEIIECLKGRNKDPSADVWQFININKRLDANEQDIGKLTIMVQDVIKGNISLITTEDVRLVNARLDKFEEKVSKMEQKLTDLQMIVNILFKDIPLFSIADNYTTAATASIKTIVPEATKIAEATAEITIDEDTVPIPEKKETAKEISTSADTIHKIPKMIVDKLAAQLTIADNKAEMRQDIATLKIEVVEIKQKLQDLNEKIAGSKILTKAIVVKPAVQEEPAVTEVIKDKKKINEMSNAVNLEQCLKVVKNVETMHGKIMNDITKRVIASEQKIEYLFKKVNDFMQATDKTNNININELVTKIQEMETDMERIEKMIDRLFNNKKKKETHINTLLEQIELLKTIKADKENLKDALANKADVQIINRKVSHDQFDAVYNDLSRGLEEVIDKLAKQDSIWQQALDEVQNKIDIAKVDKIEMTSLKDFVNNRLNSLQEKQKIITETRGEIEAAGTKKLLRDVQCISCDKNVMKIEKVEKFHAKPLSCIVNMKPYLTYQLDQVRKQQIKLPHSRNMIQFETAMQEAMKKIKKEMLAKTSKDHLYNRYCGGSHTIMTPQQKIMRVEHFLTHWGPQTVQLTDGLIKGKDGKMYRSRLMPDKLDICGLACWKS